MEAGPKSGTYLVKQVTIHDKNVVSVNDLCSNFYLTPDHVGKATRAQGFPLLILRKLRPALTTQLLCGVSQLRRRSVM